MNFNLQNISIEELRHIQKHTVFFDQNLNVKKLT